MREMIISELTQALHDLARGFAHYLPRLIVMLILAFVGWLIAYVVKVLLRSILRLIKFDRLSENAGASQLLSKAALPSATETLSRFVFWVTWLGFILLGVSVLGILGLQEQVCEVLPLSAATVRGGADLVFRDAGSWLFCSRCSAGRSECECAVPSPPEPCRPQHHHGFRIVCCL